MSSPIIYVLLVSLLILLIAVVYFLAYLLRHREQKKEYDPESCTAPETMKREYESSTLARPSLAYFTARSSNHTSARIIRSASIFWPDSKPLSSLLGNTISLNTSPIRPPRPTQTDDFLASLPDQSTMTSDVWFPVANQETGRWDLCVVNATVTIASLGSHAASIRIDPAVSHSRSIKGNPSKIKKAKCKRGGSKQKQDTPLEIPELYINARSYDDIEADQTIADLDVRSYLEEEYDTNFLFPTYGLSEST